MRAGDVTLSAPPGMGGDPLLTADSIDVGVALLPLLRQEVVVDRLVLHQPVFALRVDREGRRSWDTAQIEAPRRVRLAQADTGEGGTRLDFSPGTALAGGAEPGRERPREIGGVSLADVRILDGTVRYSDERTGAGYEIAAIGAEMQIPSIAAPLDAKGSFVWSSEKIDFDAKLTAPQDVLEDRPAKLALQLAGRPLKLSFDGAVTLKGAPSAEGRITGDAASLRELVGWLGTELAPGPGLGAVTAAGNVRVAENALHLADAKLTLDGATATGTIDVTAGGARPHVSADLAVSGLNLGNFGARAPAPRPASAPDRADSACARDTCTGRAAIRSRICSSPKPAPGPQVKGYTQARRLERRALRSEAARPLRCRRQARSCRVLLSQYPARWLAGFSGAQGQRAQGDVRRRAALQGPRQGRCHARRHRRRARDRRQPDAVGYRRRAAAEGYRRHRLAGGQGQRQARAHRPGQQRGRASCNR